MTAIVKLDPVDYTTPVVALTMAKANANIQYTDQDDLLQLFLEAAIEDAEQYTGTKIQQRNVVIKLNAWSDFVDLPAAPLTVITSIVYKDEAGADQTLTADDDYETVRDGYGLYFKMVEMPELQEDNKFPITITGEVGYAAGTAPKAIQSAILLKFAHKELFREDAPKMGNDRSFESALRPYKIWAT